MDPISDLNSKVTRTKYLDHDTLQANSLYAYNETANKLRGLRINDSNELIVTSGSGGSGSTLIKGLTDIENESTSKFINVDNSGAIKINNINASNFTDGTQMTQMVAREDISDDTTKINLKSTSEGALNIKNVNELSNDGKAQVFLNSAGGTLVKGDSTCVIQSDAEYRDGWNMVNSTSSTKFNLYVFNGGQETITLGDISSVYFKGYVNRFANIQSVPFMQVYTKPTGSGDAGGFFHSRVNWVYTTGDSIGIGEECVFWGENEPTSQFTNRKIQLNNKVSLGDALPAEEILYVVCASDSSATQNEMNATINLVGFNDTSIKRNFHLVGRDIENINETIKVNTSNINDKISKGDGDIASGGAGLQQVLCYAKDSQNNLHPIDSDTNGHLKITLQDIEPDIVASIKVSQPVERDDISVTNDSTGSPLLGSLGVGEYTETIDIDGYSNILVDVVSTNTTDSLELYVSSSPTSGFRKYSDLFAEMSGGILHSNTNVVPRYLRIYNPGTSIYTFTSITVFLAR